MDATYSETDLENLPQVLIYRVVALPSVSGISPVNSNFHQVTFPSNVFFPNAFTPNGDGLNDTFMFTGLFIQDFQMNIYNKWGELIFITKNQDIGWDGTKNSVLLPSGMYIFNAEFTDEAGVSFVKKGEVYLLR